MSSVVAVAADARALQLIAVADEAVGSGHRQTDRRQGALPAARATLASPLASDPHLAEGERAPLPHTAGF
jgi:hypothetical protein